MKINKTINNYFIILFSIIPISIMIGPSISLINFLIIDFSFLLLLFYLKDFSFFKSKPIKYLLLLYLYLILNSLISVDQSIGMARNFGFVRIIIFFVALNFFFKDKIFYQKVFIFWSTIILIVLIDVFIETILGRNIFGFGSSHGRRIVSFFKDEPVVGGFLNAFYLILIGFLYMKFQYKKNFYLISIISIIFFITIFLTGERSNTIKAFLGIALFYSIFDKYEFKQKLILVIISSIIMFSVVSNSDWFKARYVNQIKVSLTTNQLYFDLYKSGYQVFKKNYLFGVGNKNYRVVTCNSENLKNRDKDFICTTHPHQIYFEFLSEHGLIGSFFILFIFYKLIFSKISIVFKSRNYVQIGSLIYILLLFTPLLPSGAFFSNYSLSLLIINLGIFYAINEKFNIFSNPEKYKN